MNLSKTFIGGAAVATLVAAAAAAPVQAKGNSEGSGNFDGKWSVVIVTTKGDCDRAYRYPVDISRGTLINAGNQSFDISGRVQGDGSVTVRVSHGDKQATGSGRLSATDGSGSWSGGACAGTWQAERRS
jgi:hypothetical protein